VIPTLVWIKPMQDLGSGLGGPLFFKEEGATPQPQPRTGKKV